MKIFKIIVDGFRSMYEAVNTANEIITRKREYRNSVNGFEKDLEAMRKDWEKICEDMDKVINGGNK